MQDAPRRASTLSLAESARQAQHAKAASVQLTGSQLESHCSDQRSYRDKPASARPWCEQTWPLFRIETLADVTVGEKVWCGSRHWKRYPLATEPRRDANQWNSRGWSCVSATPKLIVRLRPRDKVLTRKPLAPSLRRFT